MAITFANGLDTVFGYVHSVTTAVRDLVSGIMPEYSSWILLVLGGVGAYYVYKNSSFNRGTVLMIMYALFFYVLLRYV